MRTRLGLRSGSVLSEGRDSAPLLSLKVQCALKHRWICDDALCRVSGECGGQVLSEQSLEKQKESRPGTA